ncbi:MAG: hypothetical protein EOP53_05725, partial [Sphingobacteriales bacterium]
AGSATLPKVIVSCGVVVGYEPDFGARPLKRVLQKEVINKLSKYILARKVDKNETIVIDADNHGEIVFHNMQ